MCFPRASCAYVDCTCASVIVIHLSPDVCPALFVVEYDFELLTCTGDTHAMNIKRSNTILYCDKWDATVAFYRDLFKFKITHQTDWFVEFQITPESFLSIANEKRASIDSVAGQGITLSWQVAEIENAHQYWSQQDVAVTDIKKKWGSLVFYLHDPEGHRIELWQAISED